MTSSPITAQRVFARRRVLQVTPQNYLAAVWLLAEAAQRRHGPVSAVIGVANGGLPPAQALSELLGAPAYRIDARHNPTGAPYTQVTGHVTHVTHDSRRLASALAGRRLAGKILLVDDICGSGATFGFPAPVYSRDKARLLTGLFAFFALLRAAIRDDVPGAGPEVIVVFDGEHGAAARKQVHEGYKASRPSDEQALAPLLFLPDVKRGLDNCGIAWIELQSAEADGVIATLVDVTSEPREVIILSQDRDYYQLLTQRAVVLNTRFRAGRKLVTPAEAYTSPSNGAT